MIEIKDVEHVAKLARLELTEEEKNVISQLVDIGDIKAGYFPETVDFVKVKYKSKSMKGYQTGCQT